MTSCLVSRPAKADRLLSSFTKARMFVVAVRSSYSSVAQAVVWLLTCPPKIAKSRARMAPVCIQSQGRSVSLLCFLPLNGPACLLAGPTPELDCIARRIRHCLDP